MTCIHSAEEWQWVCEKCGDRVWDAIDDSLLDGTEGAHPAWWRGDDHGFARGVAKERAHWHRTPGTYRTDDATEVVVDLPESLSWLEDEFPDEVNAVVAAERVRIAAAIVALEIPPRLWALGALDLQAVIAIVTGETP